MSSQRTPRGPRSSLPLSQPQTPAVVHDDRKSAELAQYFLIMEHRKVPVKRADLVKTLGLQGKSFKTVLEDTNKLLQSTFGYAIEELKQTSNTYILRNMTEHPSKVISADDLTEEQTVLFLTLAAIYLNGGSINEDDLWLILDSMGFTEHKKLITGDFLRQHYVTVEAVPQTEPPKKTFQWGERAELEVNKLHIIDFATRVYKTEKETFGKLYSDLTTRQEEEESENGEQ